MGPLFILGFPRSGTTALAKAVSATHRFGRWRGEGHLLYLFADGIDRIASGRLNPASIAKDEFAREQLLSDLRAMVNRLFSQTGDLNETAWFDKTPGVEQVRAVPGLLALYPEARFFYLYRAAEDAVRSNLANWPERMQGQEVALAGRWVQCQRAWRFARAHLPEDQFEEIFQPDMLADPAGTANIVAELLVLSADETSAVVEFLVKNRAVNRPNRGPRKDTYDATRLSPRTIEAISEETAEEITFWPRLSQATEIQQ